MLFPDMPKGISEMVRVAKPGARVLLHAYGDPLQIEFLGLLIRAVQSVRPSCNGPPMDPPLLEFQLADPERLRREFAGAGLKDIRVETITETTEFQSGNELWDWVVWSNPIVEHVLSSLNLTHDETGAVKQALETTVRRRAGRGGAAKLTNRINMGIGTK
jgi:hypothetical protein